MKKDEVFENQELEALVNQTEATEQTELETEGLTDQQTELTEEDRQLAAQALAGTLVNGLEKVLQLRYVHFRLDEAGQAQGVEALTPVTADFVGDMPDWLRPYAKYLSAGLFIGGLVFEAHRQEKVALQKLAKEQGRHGNQSEHGMAQPA